MEILKLLSYAWIAGLEVNAVRKDVFQCFGYFVHYCWNIARMKDIPFVKYDIAMTRPFVRCLVAITTFVTRAKAMKDSYNRPSLEEENKLKW